MLLSQKSNQLLARVNFPPYTVQCITERHILVAGGGGGSKTGIQNVIEIYEIIADGKGYKAKSVIHYETGQLAIMNCDVYSANNYFLLFTGMEGICNVFKIKLKMEKLIEAIPNGVINEETTQSVRSRKKGNDQSDQITSEDKPVNNSDPVMNLVFDIQSIQSFQTDFSKDPFQKVVKFSEAAKILATGGVDGHLRVWGYPAFNKLFDVDAHADDVDDIDFSPSGDKIITISRDGHGKIWDAENGSLICDLEYEIPSKTQDKYTFRNCRFAIVEGDEKKLALFITFNPSVRKKPPSSCCLTKWNGHDFSMEKFEFAGTEMLSSMAVSEDGSFVGLGTQEGSVKIYIAFSLQLLYHSPHVHSIFVTSLNFMKPCKASRQITGGYEAALISVSVDNHINAHYVPYRPMIGMYGLVIMFIITLFSVFVIMDYFNL